MVQQQTSGQHSTDFIFEPEGVVLGISKGDIKETLNLNSSFLHLSTKISMDSTPIVKKHLATKQESNLDLSNTTWAPNWRGWAAIISPQLFVDYQNSNINYTYKSDYKIIPILKFSEKTGLALLNNDEYVSTSTYNVEENNLLTENEQGRDVITMEYVPPTKSNNVTECSANAIIKNTFCDDDGFYKIIGKSFDFEYNITNLDQGFYVFNVNYVKLNDTCQIKVTITIGESPLEPVSLDPKSDPKSNKFPYVVFYLPSKITSGTIKVEVNQDKHNVTRGYIKNVGLFKVNNSLDNELPEEYRISKFKEKLEPKAILFSQDSNIYRSIVLQPVFCFKEVDKNGKKFGCMNETYGGFQQLPDKPYQTCISVYGLNGDKAYFNLGINNKVAQEIGNEVIGEVTIRQLNND